MEPGVNIEERINAFLPEQIRCRSSKQTFFLLMCCFAYIDDVYICMHVRMFVSMFFCTYEMRIGFMQRQVCMYVFQGILGSADHAGVSRKELCL